MPFWLLCLSNPNPNPNPRPDMVDMARVSTQTNRSNLEHAFCVAEQLGVARLLDPEGETRVHTPAQNASTAHYDVLLFVTLFASTPFTRHGRSFSR